MKVRTTLAGLLTLTIVWSASAQDKNPATTPNQRKDKGAVDRHEKFVKRAAMGDVDVLFLGVSITQGWEGAGDVWKANFEKWKPANFGIGGDRTEHVLWRLTEGKELEGIHPKLTILMIGTNNTGSNTAGQIADGVKADVEELRKQRPDMKVLLLAVFPRSDNSKQRKEPDRVAPGEFNPKIPEINKTIAKLDDGKMVKFLDINSKFLDSEGGLKKEIMPDFLHLSKKGYEIWAAAIKEPVEEMLKK